MKREIIRMVKFSGIGMLGTCTHALVFLVLFNNLALDSIIANFGAFSVSLCVSYLGHTNFTFKDKVCHTKLGWEVRLRFFHATFLGFLLNMSWAYFFIELWDWDVSTYIVALFTLTPTLAYLLNRFWVFHNLPILPAE